MNALITGASSGIGRDIARELSKKGYDLILVARRKENLEALASEISTNSRIIVLDLGQENNCFKLFEEIKDIPLDVFVNNAGFGLFGRFLDIDINKELQMIDLNIRTVHILTKLALENMQARNSGHILNVASSAAFTAGPLMAAYYATKAYVLRLSEAIYQELKVQKSNIAISVLCPGPVKTEFNKTAGVSFKMKGLSSEKVARIAVKKMFKRRLVIIPGFMMKAGKLLITILPNAWIRPILYHFSNKYTG